MRIDLEKLDNKKSFEIKLQIALINNAKRMMPYYENKIEEFNKYINERIMKIKELLDIEHGDIYENNKLIYSF
ncbi:MAG: hypothetical protein ACP5JT_04030 [Thermoplasmata archaeon]|jgi:hypothetical protein